MILVGYTHQRRMGSREFSSREFSSCELSSREWAAANIAAANSASANFTFVKNIPKHQFIYLILYITPLSNILWSKTFAKRCMNA